MTPTLGYPSLIHQTKSFSLQLCLEMQISLKYITPSKVLIIAQTHYRNQISNQHFPFASFPLNRYRWKEREPRLRRTSITQFNHLSATRTKISTSSPVVFQLIPVVTRISLSSEIALFSFSYFGLKFYFLHLLTCRFFPNASHPVTIKDAPP